MANTTNNSATFQFNAKNLIGLPPKSRTVKDENGSDVVLWSVPLQYRYDNGRVAALELDYPEMNTGRGIKTVDKKTYKKYEIVASLPMDNTDSQEFYETFVKPFNERIMDILCEPHVYQAMNKKGAPYDPKKARILMEDKYYASFFTPTNQETGETLESASPTTKLNIADFDGFKTTFVGITGRPLSDDTGKRLTFQELVDRLGRTGFSFVPRVSFSKVDIGATSIRAINSLRSVLITNFREGVADPDMSDVSARYVAKYGADRNNAITERLKMLQGGNGSANTSVPQLPTGATLVPLPLPQHTHTQTTHDPLPSTTHTEQGTSGDAQVAQDEQPWTVSSTPTSNPFKGFKPKSRK